MKMKEFMLMQEYCELSPNDAMVLHRAKHQGSAEYVDEGEFGNVSWKLYKGFENYFMWIAYGSYVGKHLWDGSMWIPKKVDSSETAIYGTGIEDVAKRVKEVYAEESG